MRDTDFIIKQGWMVTRLHLSGVALEIYALIYGYTKDGESWYECHIANISEWLLVTERTVQNHLSDLIKAGYIIRKDNKYGRGSKAFFQVSVEVIERMEKGENFSPIKRVKKTTEKGENFSKKGEKNDIAPIIKILLKDNIKIILLRACAREEEEEKEFFKIFYFLGSADPSAEVADFVRWNQAFNKDWNSQTIQQKYYFAATKWHIKEQRNVPAGWLSAWAEVYNWAVEHDPDFAPSLLDVRFRGIGYINDGEREFEISVSAPVREWLMANKEDVLETYIRPLVRNAKHINWKLI